MDANDNAQLLHLLTEERKLLERELSSGGGRDTGQPDGWGAALAPNEIETAEIEARASDISALEDRSLVENELAHRYTLVVAALTAIKQGTYGTCRICGIAIEKERLFANPAAATCKIHRES